MGRLTTHVLDLARGLPAAGLALELWFAGATPALIRRGVTNADGRLDTPLLEGVTMTAGVFEIRFMAGDYLKANGLNSGSPPFLDVIPVRFGIRTSEKMTSNCRP